MANSSPPSAAARDQIEHQDVLLAGWRHLRLVVILGALSAFGPLSIDMYLPCCWSLSGTFGLVGMLPALFVVVASQGMILPNARNVRK